MTSALWSLRQEVHESEANLGYTVRCLKKLSELDAVAHACNSTIRKAEMGRLRG